MRISLAEPAKQELQHLVDSLPLKELAAEKRYLQFLLAQKDKEKDRPERKHLGD
jgi:hypothetical protein